MQRPAGAADPAPLVPRPLRRATRGPSPAGPPKRPEARQRRSRSQQPAASEGESQEFGLTTGWSLAGTHDLVELCRLLHDAASRQMEATIFFLGLYDQGSQTVEIVWQIENGVELPGGSFPLGTGPTSEVIRTGRGRLISNWSSQGPRVQVQYATETPGLPESAVFAPLRLSDQVIGIVSAESYGEGAYGQRELTLLQTLADEAAVVIAGMHYSERLGAQVRRRVSDLESILASMADALLIIDAGGRLVRLNRAARELLCPDDGSIVLGQPLDQQQADQWPVGGRQVAEALRPIIDTLQTTEAPQEVEVELPNSGARTLSFRASPLHDASGVFNGGVIVFRDVTGRRDVERFKDEMFSIASHDLKTPATVIKAQAQLLRRRVRQGSADNQDVEEGLSMIADQADRLAKLLNLLLDMSRIGAGRLQLDLAPTDLRSILISMARALQSASDAHVISVSAPVGVIGHWDARRIEEVVQNLLSNAVKYSPAGGTIQVRLEMNDESATVLIRDPGIGLAEADLPRVFERFYRGQDIRRLEGTGLGLYICQAIVAAHGGRVWAESPGPGRGSTFGFSLPLHPA
jgi:signal transduction histidine kinase